MTAIVGGQSVPSGIQIDSQISVQLGGGQTWSVPGGHYAEVHIWNSSNSQPFNIEGSNSMTAPVSSNFSSTGSIPTWKLGPGATVQNLSGGTLYIRGVMFNNGN